MSEKIRKRSNVKSFDIYLRFRNLIGLLKRTELTAKELSELLELPLATTYKMINELLDRDVAKVSRIKITKGKYPRHYKLFTLKDKNKELQDE